MPKNIIKNLEIRYRWFIIVGMKTEMIEVRIEEIDPHSLGYTFRRAKMPIETFKQMVKAEKERIKNG